ncbi:hypothetical protein ETH98_04325 [Macrococcoides caseolyticum]|uniref:oligosaccharide flippase family protein n=1 Tax=Macrococcoides caseolyticum TaxID=69966 RepID=UPI00105BB430|nr:oligosaccharide flippase family protein [Macrococcus caseolyticus]TDM29922.1 hypothetical protein ETH98_04325 [Macrococcus caseolyticus]
MKNKFKKDAIVTLLVQGLVAISNFFILVYISREYGTESYGDFYLIKRFSDLFWVCLLIGLTVSIPRNIHKVNQITVLYTSIAVLFISLFLLFLDPINLVDFFINENKYKLVFKIFVASQMIFGLSNSIQRGMESFWKYNIFMFINFICIPLGSLIYSTNIESYIGNLAIGSIIVNTILASTLFARLIISNRNENVDMKDIYFVISYGAKRLPGLFIASFIFTFPIFVIDSIGLVQLKGYVSQIFQLFSLILLPINTIGTLLLPKLSKSIFSYDKTHYVSIYKIIMKFYAFICIGSIIVSVLIPPIVYLINSNFNYGVCITLISLGILPLSIYNLFRNFIDALSDKAWTTYIVLTSFLLAAFILYILLKTAINTTLSVSIFILTLYSLLGILTLLTFKTLNRRYINDQHTSY